MNRTFRIALTAGLVVLLAVVITAAVVANRPGPAELSLDRYMDLVAAGRIDTATIYAEEGRVEGEESDGTPYVVYVPYEFVDELTADLESAPNTPELNVVPSPPVTWVDRVLGLLPYVVLIAIAAGMLWYLQGSRRFGLLRKARVLHKDRPKVTFADVAGADEAVEELEEIKEFLTDPERFRKLGARIPRGVLLYGPPGTGKTLLARAVAGEAGVPFYSISGSDFVEMFVGVGAARVRDLFKDAKANAPAIVFVDEIDAVGRQRGAGVGGGHDEREQTLNALLVETDGFVTETDIVLIAATNRPDILDPALLRPGRFDRQIAVDHPDLAGRERILELHTKGKPVKAGVDLLRLARRTVGFTGADLGNVVNEAALLAARRQRRTISGRELDEAVERVLAGPERRSRLLSASERRVTAVHESGHAVVGHALPNADPVHKVTIVGRGKALGYTMALPEEDRTLLTRSEFIDQLAMLLGGRAAEEIVFGEPTNGASDDIRRASALARQLVCDFGMSETLGPRHYGSEQTEVFLGRDLATGPAFSDAVAAAIDAEISRILDAAVSEAREIVQSHRGTLDKMTERLLESETLEGEELEGFLAAVPAWQNRRPVHIRQRPSTALGRDEAV